MFALGRNIYATGMVHAAAYARHPALAAAGLRALLQDGAVDAVECAGLGPGEERQDLLNLVHASGCDLVYVAGAMMRRRGIDPSETSPELWTAGLDRMKAIVEEASSLGARLLLMSSGPDTAPAARPAAKDQLGCFLRALCRHAEMLRPDDPLWITLEHFDRDLDKRLLLGPTRETAELVGDVRRDQRNVGVTCDLSHIVQLGEAPREAIALLGDLLIHAHGANCGLDPNNPTTFGDSHCVFAPGMGAVDTEQVAQFILDLDDHGFGQRTVPTRWPLISMEMIATEAQEPSIVVANGLRTLHRASTMAGALRSAHS